MDVEFRAGIVDGTKFQDLDKSGDLNPIEHPNIELRDYYIQSKLNYSTSDNHFFHIQASVENFNRQQRYRIELPDTVAACLRNPNDNPLYVRHDSRKRPCGEGAGGTPQQAQNNAGYGDSRPELEFQDNGFLNDVLNLVSGPEFREDGLRSETYF